MERKLREREKQTARAEDVRERAQQQFQLSKPPCNLLCPNWFFFRDKPKFMISTTAPVWKEMLIRFKKKKKKKKKKKEKSYQWRPCALLQTLSPASFWRILSPASQLEHNQGAFRLAGGRKTPWERREVERRLDGVWREQSVLAACQRGGSTLLVPRGGRCFPEVTAAQLLPWKGLVLYSHKVPENSWNQATCARGFYIRWFADYKKCSPIRAPNLAVTTRQNEKQKQKQKQNQNQNQKQNQNQNRLYWPRICAHTWNLTLVTLSSDIQCNLQVESEAFSNLNMEGHRGVPWRTLWRRNKKAKSCSTHCAQSHGTRNRWESSLWASVRRL